MRGIVKGLSKNKQRVAVITDEGYTVFDTDAGEASIGDVINGSLDDHGQQDLTNQTTGRRLSVYIEAIQATPECAQSLLSHR